MSAHAEAVVDLRAPDDLTERDQWLLWRHEARDGKPTKIPYSVRGYRASSTEPRDWASFEVALSAWRKNPHGYTGLGFVFTRADPFAGIDLDDSLDAEGNVAPWARGIVERFSDTYMEISPSGRGLKIWTKARLPANLPGVKVGDGVIELYDHSRYFAVTGRVFRGAPLQIEDHAADVRALYDHLTRPKGTRWKLQPLSGGRIPYGQQHSVLVSIAGTLRARHVCDEAIEACLQIINTRQCERPGPPENIARIVRSSRRWGAMA